MDMDMDVNWCLSCSKRTLDARNPYCSEACRQADIHVAATNAEHTTSPSAATQLFSGNPFSPSPKHANSASGRPPLTPLVPPLVIAPISDPLPRDRRAFSFPAAQMFDPLTKRRDSMILPAFARKPKMTNHQTTTNATPVFSTTPRSSLAVPAGEKLSRSTGANTPLVIESVFCSTSESSDNEGVGKRNKIRLSATTATTAKPSSHTRVSRSARPSLPAEFNKNPAGSLRAPSYLASKEYASRQKSQSPVSTMAGVMASSSSSRSREDIITWAKAVKSRPGDTDTSEDESRINRGRSRTRKDSTPETVKEVPEDDHEHEHLATTPKGRMESVFSGLTMGRFGVGPIVKALTSVTGTGSAATAPPPPLAIKRQEAGTRALTSAPSPAMVSKVAVVSSTAAGNSGFAIDDNQVYFGGATPTLSTVSLSEVNDPTSVVTDMLDQDHGDLMTNDDQSISAASSSHRHQRSTNMMREAQSKAKKSTLTKTQKQQAQPPSPVRPANTTSSVIWNLSTYLRSFTPFTLPSPSARTSQQTSPGKGTPSTEISEPVSNAITSPVPASRMASRAPSPGTELVRSLPLNIIAPIGGTAFNEDRARHREAQEYIESMSRRSRSRRGSPKRPSRSRGRSPSTRPLESGTVHARNWSYDADQSEAEEELAEEKKDSGADDRRGRSSRSKALVGDDVAMIHHVEHMTQQRLEERSRSRGRDVTDTRASRSRGRRESPRGRGRDRTARVV